MSVDNRIEIEILALLDAKSGGIVDKEAFAKSIAKDLKKLIRETETTLKELSVHPELYAHPKFKGVKHKREFIAAVKRDGKSLLREAKKEFEKLSPEIKLKIGVDINHAKKEFVRQLDVLQRALTGIAKRKGKEIEAAMTAHLRLSPQAMVALNALASSGRSGTVLSAANRGVSTVSGAGAVNTLTPYEQGKILYKQFGRDLNRIGDKHLSKVNQYLSKELDTLASKIAKAPKNVGDLEKQYKQLVKDRSEVNRRFVKFSKEQEKYLQRREKANSTVERLLSKGVQNYSGDPARLERTMRDYRSELSKLINKTPYGSRDRESLLKERQNVEKLVGNLAKLNKSEERRQELISRRDKLNKVLGEGTIAKNTKLTPHAVRALNLLSDSVNNSELFKKGKLVVTDHPSNVESRKRLLAGMETAIKTGLISQKKIPAFFRELKKSLPSPAKLAQDEGRRLLRLSPTELRKLNDSSLAKIKKYLDAAQLRVDDRVNKHLLSGKDATFSSSAASSLADRRATINALIRGRAEATQKQNEIIKAVGREVAEFKKDSSAFNKERRRLLVDSLKAQKTELLRRRRREKVGTSEFRKLTTLVHDTENAISKIAPTVKGHLNDSDRVRLVDKISDKLGLGKGSLKAANTFTSYEDHLIEDFNKKLGKGLNSILKPLGKDSTYDERQAREQHLSDIKEGLLKLERKNIIDTARSNRIRERINLAQAKNLSPHLKQDYSSRLDNFLHEVETGQYSGRQGIITGNQRGSDLLKEIETSINTMAKASKNLDDHLKDINDNLTSKKLSKEHRRELENRRASLIADRNSVEAARNKAIRDRELLQTSKSRLRLPEDVDRQGFGLLIRQFARLYLGFAALGGVVQGAVMLVREITALDTALKSIQAAALGTTEEMNNIKGAIQTVGITTKFTVSEIADAARILVQADVALADVPKTLKATANLAAATDSEVGLSADLMTSFMKVYTGYTPDETANLLAKTFNLSKLAAEDLQVILGISTQTAKAMGLTGEQFLSAAVVLKNQGLKASTAATGLRQAMFEIFSPDSKTVEKLVARYAAIGENLSGGQVREKFGSFRNSNNPLLAAVAELKRLGFGGSNKQEFSRFIDIRAENALLALANNIKELSQREFQLGFGNAATTASEIQLRSLEATIKNLGAAITVVANSAFEPLLDVIKDTSRSFTSFLVNLKKANDVLKGRGETGVEGLVTSSLLGGIAGTMLASRSKFNHTVGKVVGAGAGGLAGLGASGYALSNDVSPDGIELSIESLLTLMAVYSSLKGIGASLGSSRAALARAANLDKDVAGISPILIPFIDGTVGFFSKLAKKLPILGTISSFIGSAIASIKKWAGAVTGFLGIAKSIAGFFIKHLFALTTVFFLVKSAYEYLVDSDVDLNRQIAARKNTIESLQQEIEDIKSGTATYIDEEGATTAHVIQQHAEAVNAYYAMIKEKGIVAKTDQEKITGMVSQVIEDGLDANSASYRELAAELQNMTDVTEEGVGTLIRELVTTKERIDSSTQAIVEGIKKDMASLEDKLTAGGTLEAYEQDMLDAWRNLLATNTNVYIAFMGSLSDKARLSITEYKDAINKLKVFKNIAETARFEELNRTQPKLATEVTALSRIQVQKALETLANAGSNSSKLNENTSGNIGITKGLMVTPNLHADYMTTTKALNKSVSLFRKVLDELHTSFTVDKKINKKEFQEATLAAYTQFTDGLGKLSEDLPGFDTEKAVRLAQTNFHTVLKMQNDFEQNLIKINGRVADNTLEAYKNAEEQFKKLSDTKISLEGELKKRFQGAKGVEMIQILNQIKDEEGFKALKNQVAVTDFEGNRKAKRIKKQLTNLEDFLNGLVPRAKAFNTVRRKHEDINDEYNLGTKLKRDKEELAHRKGYSEENKRIARQAADEEIKLAKLRLENAKKKINALSIPTKGADTLYTSDLKDIRKAEKEAAEAEAKYNKALKFAYEDNLKKLKPKAGRSKVDREKSKREAALSQYEQKVAQLKIDTLKKELQALSYADADTPKQIQNIEKNRLRILNEITNLEKKKADVAATKSEAYLPLEKRKKAAEMRETAFREKIAALTEKEAEARKRALTSLEKKEKERQLKRASTLLKETKLQTKIDLEKIKRENIPLPPLFANVKGNQKEKDLFNTASYTSALSLELQKLRETLSVKRSKITDRDVLKKFDSGAEKQVIALQTKTTDSVRSLADKFSSFVGDTTFGKQLELLATLNDTINESPWTEVLTNLPATLADAVISPFYSRDSESDTSLGDDIRESVKTAIRGMGESISKSYFRQATAEFEKRFLSLFNIDENILLSKEEKYKKLFVSALDNNVNAIKELTRQLKVASGVSGKFGEVDQKDTDKKGSDPLFEKPKDLLEKVFDGFDLKTKLSDFITPIKEFFSNNGFFSSILGDFGGILKRLFGGLISGSGGSGGIGSWLGAILGFNKGVSGYGGIQGKKGIDKVPAVGQSSKGLDPIWVGEGESILTKDVSKMVGYDTIANWNAGNLVRKGLLVPTNQTSQPSSQQSTIIVDPPVAQIYVTPEQIEQALTTKTSRDTIGAIAKEAVS